MWITYSFILYSLRFYVKFMILICVNGILRIHTNKICTMNWSVPVVALDAFSLFSCLCTPHTSRVLQTPPSTRIHPRPFPATQRAVLVLLHSTRTCNFRLSWCGATRAGFVLNSFSTGLIGTHALWTIAPPPSAFNVQENLLAWVRARYFPSENVCVS